MSFQCNQLHQPAQSRALMQIFAIHGLPKRIVSDNGPQFCSQEFKDFLTVNSIQHIQSVSYHPATNREEEIFVQIFKHMKCRKASGTNVHFGISKFLLTFRTTCMEQQVWHHQLY